MNGYGFEYMVLKSDRHPYLHRTLEMAEKFVDDFQSERAYEVSYWTNEKWWKTKTYKSKETANRVYDRMKSRFIVSKREIFKYRFITDK